MNAFFAMIVKELKLLWRDRAGILLLFLMPVVLVLVITLVQQNVLKIAGESGARIVIVDDDRHGFGEDIAGELQGMGIMAAVVEQVESSGGRDSLLRRCRLGEIQAVIEIPTGFTKALDERIEAVMRAGAEVKAEAGIKVFFDPTIMTGLRAGVLGAVRAAAGRLEAKMTGRALKRFLPDRIRAALIAAVGPAAAMAPVTIPDFPEGGGDMARIEARNAGRGPLLPNAVQHNVPAWSLFGIFFIVVPLAAVILDERRNHTFARLLAAPVSRFSLVSSRILAYTLVAFVQFILLFAIGAWLLPALGTDALVLPDATAALLMTLLAASFAASGYGFLVGVLARTHEQAAMFGAISVVVAAAIGGVMVPVYAMPPMMRAASIISPLGWGLDGLLSLFVRGVGLAEIWPDLLRLVIFGGSCLGFSWWRLK